jgi:putative SOS response-associated peptidase YedK
MCGRYTLTQPGEAIATLFRLNDPGDFPPRYNAAPTQALPVARRNREGGLTVRAIRWGLVPFFSREGPGSQARMINARAETVAEKPAFRAAFARRRCLVPADGFFEWAAVPGEKTKQPYWITLGDRAPFAFAGLWERWQDPEREEKLDSFTILVTAANTAMASLHERMPVILARDDHAVWLEGDKADAQALLRPCPDDWLAFTPVSRRVNKPSEDDATLLEPQDLSFRQQLR